jgi:hypothetical protein
VFHHLHVTNVATFAWLERTSLEEAFEFDPNGATAYVPTTMDAQEIDQLVDLHEWIRTNRNAMTVE